MKIGDLVRLNGRSSGASRQLLDDSLWLVLRVEGQLIKVQKIKTGYTTSLNKGAFEVVNANR